VTAPYLWPVRIKRLVLTTSVLLVVVAYTMLCGGLTALVALSL
jgi:hypothetical protein